jgi:hypothetical protein
LLRGFSIALLLSLFTSLIVFSAQAANPSGGTLTETSGPRTYTAGPFVVANVTATAGEVICTSSVDCDDYALTVTVPASYESTHNVRVKIEWPTAVADFDLYVLDASGAVVAQAASTSDPEVAILPAVSASYTVRVVPFAPLGESFTGTISLDAKPSQPEPGEGPAPTYQNYTPPSSLRLSNDAGEPSIGANWKTGKVMFQSYTATYRVSFDDTASPATARWEDKSAPTSVTSFDPILFTDPQTGRTIVSQLLPSKASLSSFTDDDGETWTPSQGAGVNSGVDHQTVGGGPYAPGGGSLNNYPNAVYYCSQDIAAAYCAFSRDGGMTYGPAVPLYDITQCGGLHGHVKVAPDGTVYVPNKGCGGQQGVAVSTDNGLTWVVRKVPGSIAGDSDPSVGIGEDGTVYFGYHNGDGHPRVAVSRDRGQTWLYDQDVGTQFNIQNIVFPSVVAGDSDRAAFAFLGTPTGGNYQDTANFRGVWHLYVAHTFDGGQTWVTTDVTPNDPVQRGSICTGGTTCGNDRNLLDFMDVTVDKEGRVLVGYADGCIGACVQNWPNSFSAYATIARQADGRRLFKAYDPAVSQAKPDLTITNIVATQSKPKQTTLTATVQNTGTADATNAVVRFLDGANPIADSAAVATLAKGATTDVSITWSGTQGDHVITAVADPVNAIAELNEGNNKAQRTLTLRGNKVSNSSFEQSSDGSTPTSWSGSQGTQYETSGTHATDGSRAVSLTGTGGPASLLQPAWTSAPISVTPGTTYNLAVNVATQGVSSAPSLQVIYLDATGGVVNKVSAITTSLTGTNGVQQVLGKVTIPSGVSQLRLALTGFSATDLSTSGTVWFDDVWMW